MASPDFVTYNSIVKDAGLEKIFPKLLVAYLIFVVAMIWALKNFFWISILGLSIIGFALLREFLFLKENIAILSSAAGKLKDIRINKSTSRVDLNGKEISLNALNSIRIKVRPMPKLKGISSYYINDNFVNAVMEFDVNSEYTEYFPVQNRKIIKELIDVLISKKCTVSYDMKELRL